MTDFEEKYKKDPEKYNKKIFGKQKVKLHKIKHWIFDFGGVMVETPNIVKNMLEILNTDLGTNMSKDDPFISKQRRKMSSGRITSREFLESLLDKYYYPYQKKDGSLPPEKVNIDYYLELWFELYSRVTQLRPEMEEIIIRLHNAGYTVSLLSNTYDIHVKSNKLKGFFDLFDHVFLSNELGMRKPEIEKYKYVLEQLDAKPEECIFVDDKLINLVPARELGMIVIQFKNFELFRQYLTVLGIEKIDSNLRKQILKKYEEYIITKKEFKKIKKQYKKTKKLYKKLKKKKKKKRRYIFQYRKVKKYLKQLKKEYEIHKLEYSRQKRLKKEVLERKLQLKSENSQKYKK
ncbi:MAG: HAD family hydrolase [Promethearchaeota archaeon]